MNEQTREQELEEALMLMVYQYCSTGLASEGGVLDHRFMSAGENAFRVLGLKQFDSVAELENRLFGSETTVKDENHEENLLSRDN